MVNRLQGNPNGWVGICVLGGRGVDRRASGHMDGQTDVWMEWDNCPISANMLYMDRCMLINEK